MPVLAGVSAVQMGAKIPMHHTSVVQIRETTLWIDVPCYVTHLQADTADFGCSTRFFALFTADTVGCLSMQGCTTE